MGLVVMILICSYAIGAIPFAYILARAYGKDVRTIGSGNIGATNLARALGRTWGYVCFVLDVLKGLVPMLVTLKTMKPIFLERGGTEMQFLWLWLAVGCAAVMGHVFPVYLGFKGGKGVSTSLGVGLGLWPYYTSCAALAFGVWVVVVLIWRYISLASIAASVSFPLILSTAIAILPAWELSALWPLLVVATIIPVMVILLHRTNIARLLAGTEHRVLQSNPAKVYLDTGTVPGAEPKRILVWLPSPLGDAVLSTASQRAIRTRFARDTITFYANPIVRQALEPSSFCDLWLTHTHSSPLSHVRSLRGRRYTHAILMKNSFGSALACWMAGIPNRTGYARDGRSLLLTDRIHPPKTEQGAFMPGSMVEYYLAVARHLGCRACDQGLELSIDPTAQQNLERVLPELSSTDGPLVVLVPGAAFGSSKCWPTDRFAQVARHLVDRHHALVLVSVAPNEWERHLGSRIAAMADRPLVDLGQRSMSLALVKALIARADLVITNDTGPRYIAIALGRRVLTLFGPVDKAWADTGRSVGIDVVGHAPCMPCGLPECRQSAHLCMESIQVEAVCQAADRMLGQAVKPKPPPV